MMDGRGGEGRGREAGRMEDDRKNLRQRGTTIHRLKAHVRPEEEDGRQESGG